MVLVSVIITTYNRPYSIVKRAIESVMNQTFENIEIIIVNDTPFNNPLFEEVSTQIKEYGEQVLYISEGINKGACYVRNLGFEYSKGDYIAFLDDDDVWNQDKINKQLIPFKKSNFSMVTVGFESITIDNEGKEVKRVSKVRQRNTISVNDVLKKNIVGGASAPLIKREAFIKSGKFDVNMPAAQDYDLWIRIAEIGEIYYISEPLQKYYIYDGERISNSSKNKIKGYLNLLEKHADISRGNKSFFVNKHIIIAYHYYNIGDKSKGKYHFLLAIKQIKFTFVMLNYSMKIIKLRSK